MYDDFVEQIGQIPTLPSVLIQLMELLNSQDAQPKQIEEIILNDQALTFKILALANSAHYGFRHEIDTVQRAVVAIGFEEVRDICLGAGLMDCLNPKSYDDPEQASQLWLHSLAVAEGSRLAAKAGGKVEPAIAYTGGLLHDLGMVVLAAYFPDHQATLLAYMKKHKVSRLTAEESLDLRHTQIGRALAEHWNLPPVFADIIEGHHQPDPKGANLEAVVCVYLADNLVRLLKLGDSGDPDPPQFEAKLLKKAGLGTEQVKEVSRQLAAKRQDVENLWGCMLG